MDDEKNPKEYEQEFLADAKRRAHDEELEMLANIAIIRSTMMGQRDKMPEVAAAASAEVRAVGNAPHGGRSQDFA